ncbi:MAG TPA: DinB family protein [Candidatus Eisenbacteria bacterium]
MSHADSSEAAIRLNLAWNAWANRETLASLRAASHVPSRALGVIGHIVGAERLWLRRMGHDSAPLPVWPQLTIDHIDSELRSLSIDWDAWTAGLDEDSLARFVDYTNSKGESFRNTVVDILSHVTHHSSYHRGQIATLMVQAGEVPACTDYIECVRRGFLDGGWPAG